MIRIILVKIYNFYKNSVLYQLKIMQKEIFSIMLIVFEIMSFACSLNY